MMINKRLINSMGDSKKYIGFNILFQWIKLVCNVVIMFLLADILGHAFQKSLNFSTVKLQFIIIVLLIVLRAICTVIASKMSFLASTKVKGELRKQLYEKLLELGSAYHEHIATSEVVQVAVEGIEQLEIYMGRYLPQFFYSLLAPITLFIIISTFSFKSALVLFLCVPLIPGSIIAVQKIAKKLLSKYWGQYTKLGSSFLENLQGLTTLKIYEADEHKQERMNEEAEVFRKVTMKVLTMQLNSVTLMDLIAYGGAALGIIVSLIEYQKGHITLSQNFVIIMLAAEFFIPLRLLGSFFHIAMNGMAASDKMFKIFDLDVTNQENQVEIRKSNCKEDTVVSLQNVSFSYNEDKQTLHDINVEIHRGQFIAIAGQSGCGKSTIASLVMGLRKNYKGQMKLFGIEQKNILESSRLRHVAMVSHDSYLFKGTVRDNLLMANPLATDAVLYEALRKVNLYDFVKANGGLDMLLQEQASNLSGGQRQRLSLARALVFDCELYIFDEATSNIDVESEESIMNVIRELKKTKTILFISHRLSQIVDSDGIYYMEAGCVKAYGTHAALMSQSTGYETMFKTQQELEQYGMGGQ